jgi:hypothetical protein
MRRVLVSLILVLALAGGVWGCTSGLSKERQARVDALVAENVKLATEAKDLYAKVKAGELPLADMMALTVQITAQTQKNLDEIKSIHDEAVASGATAGGIIGVFARTLLHAATKIPLPGPLGIVGNLLGMLLGGSSTDKKTTVEPPPTT